MVSLFRIYEIFKIFFAEAPFTATYCASKHALQVCDWDQNAVKQSYSTIASYSEWFEPRSFSSLYIVIVQLTNTIHLTLKMTSAWVVETSVTNNSSFQNYTHPDNHTIRTIILYISIYHVQRTRLLTSSTDKHHSLDSEDDFRSGC